MNFKPLQITMAAAALSATGLFGLGATTTEARQEGLVNVALVDTTVQVPLAVAANICDVNVNALAEQLALGPTDCGADATASAVDSDNGGNGNPSQTGLVNISAEDTTVQVPVAVAANLCDVNVNILARQLAAGDNTCDAVGDTSAEG